MFSVAKNFPFTNFGPRTKKSKNKKYRRAPSQHTHTAQHETARAKTKCAIVIQETKAMLVPGLEYAAKDAMAPLTFSSVMATKLLVLKILL